MSLLSLPRSFAFPLLLALLAAGCDDGFDPFVEDERAFALHGLLDARRDTQFVRVQDLQAPGGEVPERLAARLTSTDLEDGTRVEWRDSLLVLAGGARGHLFFAPFRVEAARSYRLEAVAEAGGASTATVLVPAPPEVEERPPVVLSRAVTQTLVLVDEAQPLLEASVVYRARHLETGASASLEVPYRAIRGAEGQRVFVELSRDAARLREALGVAPEDSASVALLGTKLRFALAGAPAPVENGTGEVLAVGAFAHAWMLPDSTLLELGLVDAQGEEERK